MARQSLTRFEPDKKFAVTTIKITITLNSSMNFSENTNKSMFTVTKILNLRLSSFHLKLMFVYFPKGIQTRGKLKLI